MFLSWKKLKYVNGRKIIIDFDNAKYSLPMQKKNVDFWKKFLNNLSPLKIKYAFQAAVYETEGKTMHLGFFNRDDIEIR